MRKVLFSNGMSDDYMLIITDAPKDAIEEWCYNYNANMENGVNTYFEPLKENYYVKVLADSEINDFNRLDIEIIGYDESYDLCDYWEKEKDKMKKKNKSNDDQEKLLEELKKNWSLSSYNEDTCDQLDYYLNESECEAGDKAYLYDHLEDVLEEMEIVHIICRLDDTELYDKLLENDDVLLDGEVKYQADTSAEFITDNDCHLVWFKYV